MPKKKQRGAKKQSAKKKTKKREDAGPELPDRRALEGAMAGLFGSAELTPLDELCSPQEDLRLP